MSIFFIADTHFGDERILRYDGALFLDGTQTPVQIETFGLEHIGEYLDEKRLVTHKAARKVREFGTSGAKK